MKPLIVLLRGLNSFGDESLRIGGLPIGPMMRPWSRSFLHRACDVIVIHDMQSGAIESHVTNAIRFLSQTPEWQSGRPLHFIGHSTGGLIARALAHHPEALQKPIRSIITIATPHFGATLADRVEKLQELKPWLNRMVRATGYDYRKKLDSFADLKPSRAEKFNQRFNNRAGISYASLVYALPRHEMSWPVQIVHHGLWNMVKPIPATDGFVEESSQHWGENLATLPLDHLMQIGYNFSLPSALRHKKLELYEQQIDLIVQKIKNLAE